ncbi:MAG: hypothetical protein HQL30_03500 [Candidatus Omnitrophica bacterium]|nr:hypothetical protein [Candidatus Omnitrophota bacterium]
MGLKKPYLEYILECAAMSIGDLRGKKMLELGDQEVSGEGIPEKTGKEYFTNRGVIHTSFDLNGRRGALKVDLSKPIKKPEWLSQFDIVTNAGTLEHVEPYEAQYTCFKNVHDCLKTGGIAIHFLPDIKAFQETGKWKGHCNNFYSVGFVDMLVKYNDYTLILLRDINGLVCPCYRKNSNKPFMGDREVILKSIERLGGGTVYHGINDPIFNRLLRLPYYAMRKIHLLASRGRDKK